MMVLSEVAQRLSMNTLSDAGGWIGDDLLAELASQSVQNAVLPIPPPRIEPHLSRRSRGL